MFQTYKKKYLLVDSSYLMHYRANATFKWYKEEFAGSLPYLEDNCFSYDFVSDDEYMEHYYNTFFNQITNIAQSHNCSFKDMILAIDCKRSEIWRKEYYEPYKANRDKPVATKYPNLRPVFRETLSYIIPKLKKELGFTTIHVDHAEADDVIAVMAKYISINLQEEVLICANDMDISQLCNESIGMVALDGTDIRAKMIDKFGTGERLVEHKALSGDRGDNIPSVKFRKMGDKTAMKYLDDPEGLERFFEENPDSLEKYELHKTLVDLNNIPLSIKKQILIEYIHKTKEDCDD